MNTITFDLAAKVVRPRPAISHKGTFGRVFIIGGAEQYGGAAILSASAAVYAGAGLVTVALAATHHAALRTRLPEAMAITWTDEPAFSDALRAADVIVIGPGLGVDAAALAVLRQTLAAASAQQTLIIDGSAITLCASQHLKPAHNNVVWTPHQMEWQRLSGLAIADQTPAANQAAAAALPGTVIVKQHRTEIFTPTAAFVNPIGGPELATGGSGDTLTGILAAFIGQFSASAETICAAVYTHSAVAAAIAKTQYVALPTAVIAALPGYMRQLANQTVGD